MLTDIIFFGLKVYVSTLINSDVVTTTDLDEIIAHIYKLRQSYPSPTFIKVTPKVYQTIVEYAKGPIFDLKIGESSVASNVPMGWNNTEPITFDDLKEAVDKFSQLPAISYSVLSIEDTYDFGILTETESNEIAKNIQFNQQGFEVPDGVMEQMKERLRRYEVMALAESLLNVILDPIALREV